MNKSGAIDEGAVRAIALLLAGCMVGPNYHAAEPGALGVPADYAPPVTPPGPAKRRRPRPISPPGGSSSATPC